MIHSVDLSLWSITSVVSGLLVLTLAEYRVEDAGEPLSFYIPSPRMLLSFATCTCSAQFFNARNNNAIY